MIAAARYVASLSPQETNERYEFLHSIDKVAFKSFLLSV